MSNSKSEDTQDFTPDEAVVCTKCGYGEWRHDSLKHPCNVFEPTQDTSLTEITAEYFMATDPDRVALQRKVLAWHKAEIAKLFEQIRSEAVRMNIPWGDGNGYDVVKAIDVEVLTKMEEL